MKTVVSGRTVEWDDSKNELNEKKHGIDFSTAALVFTDNARLEFFDAKHSDEEDRYIVLGKVGRVLFVVYTERGDSTRIISARLATNAEEKIYYGDN
ncbi:MAG: BrnT family toxin [Treponema sp.]|nr:BrnT family toxin [Treponema sp.]